MHNMESIRILKIGFYFPSEFPISDEYKANFLSNKENGLIRLLLLLVEYLTVRTKTFDGISLVFTSEENIAYPNGSLSGMFALFYQNKCDIAMPLFAIN